MTQQRVAAECNCDGSRISRLESDKLAPTDKDVTLLDQLFQTAPELAELAARSSIQRSPRRRQSTSEPRAELPPPPGQLLGRDEDIGRIVEHLTVDTNSASARPVRTCLVHGLPGVGKTALVASAADQLSRRFADGQLYLDLHGYTPDRPRVPALEALDTVLRRLGTPGAEIPATGISELIVELRTRIGARQLLVLIENATDVEQIQPLLSAMPGSSVIVTSRSPLSGLDDACRIELKGLSESAAAELFRLSAAPRSLAERPEANDENAAARLARIVQLCYMLPLAIRIVAGRFRSNRTLALEDIEADLADPPTRLAGMTDGERSMMAVLSTSYAMLPEQQRIALARLAIHPGVRIDRYSCGALFGASPERARSILNGLLATYWVVGHSIGIYQIHDIIHDFLRHGELEDPLTAAQRQEARAGLFDYYLRTAMTADRLIEPHRHQIDVSLAPEPPFVRSIESTDEAALWLDHEQNNILDVCREMLHGEFYETCWKFCYYLRGYFFSTKQWTSWVEVFDLGASAARHLGDRGAEGIMLNNAGVALAAAGDAESAVQRHLAAREAFEEVGDQHGVMTAEAHCGWAYYLRGDHEGAVRNTENALRFYRANGSVWNVATTLESLAYIELECDGGRLARKHYGEARDLFLQLGLNKYVETMELQFRAAQATHPEDVL